MYGLTISQIFALFFANNCSNRETHFNTPFYESKDLCCSHNKCVSFDVAVSSLKCYLNIDISNRDDVNGIPADIKLTGTHREEQLVLHGSCKDWEEGSTGCKINLIFKMIRGTSFGKTNVNQKSGVNYVTTTVDHTATRKVQPQFVCSFLHDGKTKTCWKVISSPVSRPKAEESCAQLPTGGRLAVLDTLKKYQSVRRLITKSNHKVCVHIGGKKSKSGKFIWLNKADVGKYGWCPGEPSGAWHETLLSLWPESNYCLDDLKSEAVCDYVCEFKQ